ncbi:unnamed protein product [Linum trigynum]|uniref:Secreted protein n=1 Tax=Linum trigynum TaxID=586398 RepID=A0AAV2FE28_9ROSI
MMSREWEWIDRARCALVVTMRFSLLVNTLVWWGSDAGSIHRGDDNVFGANGSVTDRLLGPKRRWPPRVGIRAAVWWDCGVCCGRHGSRSRTSRRADRSPSS